MSIKNRIEQIECNMSITSHLCALVSKNVSVSTPGVDLISLTIEVQGRSAKGFSEERSRFWARI